MTSYSAPTEAILPNDKVVRIDDSHVTLGGIIPTKSFRMKIDFGTAALIVGTGVLALAQHLLPTHQTEAKVPVPPVAQTTIDQTDAVADFLNAQAPLRNDDIGALIEKNKIDSAAVHQAISVAHNTVLSPKEAKRMQAWAIRKGIAPGGP